MYTANDWPRKWRKGGRSPASRTLRYRAGRLVPGRRPSAHSHDQRRTPGAGWRWTRAPLPTARPVCRAVAEESDPLAGRKKQVARRREWEEEIAGLGKRR